ncbi:helix-turn-helix domain-containing protein [Geodermatophilus sp. DSM 44513]|uniref:winged helix-turn-helix transcriptional regulator n=1 Tax=Geodermatophilus sp. DSM 44513 TaxID=1528104 RepID=UPI001274BA81|nr:helix-turn-helix domain-containing protein [Geodermatophilus sp. DSM 44513]WNV77043.1 helix-turn-helix domain-containing protein [Geodermatophilus sp. DSM 44513]
MLHSDYPEQTCSIARSLEAVGERWTLLILRDVLLGTTRFDDLVESLGITRTVLARRLDHLVEEGVLERRPYQQRPERFAYTATPKGRALGGVLTALMHWGDAYYPASDGPPRLMLHRGCGGAVRQQLTCTVCAERVDGADVDAVPGPGLGGRDLHRTGV